MLERVRNERSGSMSDRELRRIVSKVRHRPTLRTKSRPPATRLTGRPSTKPSIRPASVSLGVALSPWC
jgi:hypothetical protein